MLRSPLVRAIKRWRGYRTFTKDETIVAVRGAAPTVVERLLADGYTEEVGSIGDVLSAPYRPPTPET